MNHFLERCSCGIVLNQCRCPGMKRETVSTLPCTHQAAMTDHAQRAHARRAITCLYLQLPESIAKDVEDIIEAAFAEDDRRIAQSHAAGRREGMEEATT